MDPPETIKIDFETGEIVVDTVEKLIWYFGDPDFEPKPKAADPDIG